MLFKKQKTRSKVPSLKVLEACDFRRVAGGVGTNGQATSEHGLRGQVGLRHTAGASADV